MLINKKWKVILQRLLICSESTNKSPRQICCEKYVKTPCLKSRVFWKPRSKNNQWRLKKIIYLFKYLNNCKTQHTRTEHPSMEKSYLIFLSLQINYKCKLNKNFSLSKRKPLHTSIVLPFCRLCAQSKWQSKLRRQLKLV